MTNQDIDNSDGNSIQKAILWQYDSAEKLKALILKTKDFYEQTTHNLWDFIANTSFQIDNADALGLIYWGSVLGVDLNSISNITDSLKRKYIKALFVLKQSNMSHSDIDTFISTICDGEGGSYKITSDGDLALTFSVVGTPSDGVKALYDAGLLAPYPAAVHDNDGTQQKLFSLVGSDSETGTYKDLIVGLGESETSGGSFGDELLEVVQ